MTASEYNRVFILVWQLSLFASAEAADGEVELRWIK